MPSIGLPLGSYDVEKGSTSRLVNCYIEGLPPDASTPARLVRAPGIKSRHALASSEFPALEDEVRVLGTHHTSWGGRELVHIVFTNFFRAAPDTYILELSKTGGTDGTRLFQASTYIPFGYHWGAYPVDMASNIGSVIVVSSPVAMAAYPISSGYAAVAIDDPDFTSRGASQVEFLDNYLLFLESESGRFFGADLGSAVDFSALNFATAESQPDDAVAIKVNRGALLVFGLSSLEMWANAGVQGFPFQRVPNGRVDIGCLSPVSVKEVGSQGNATAAWLASDKTIRALDGLTPAKLSTLAIDRQLNRGNESSVGNSWAYNGHSFYSITTQDGTFVYDVTTGQWHERRTYGRKDWIANHFVNAFGEALCSYKHHIGQMDAETYTDVGEIQLMQWTSQPVIAEGKRAFHDRLEVLMETGVGLSTGQGSDPRIMLEVSDDGGRSFRHFETKSIGARGERQTRVIWNGLGSSTNRVYRWSVSDPVPVTVIDTQLYARGAAL